MEEFSCHVKLLKLFQSLFLSKLSGYGKEVIVVIADNQIIGEKFCFSKKGFIAYLLIFCGKNTDGFYKEICRKFDLNLLFLKVIFFSIQELF